MRALTFLLACLLLAAALPCRATAEVMQIQVKEGVVRSSPSFLGEVTGKLPYGTSVQTIGDQTGWVQVVCSSASGWMHSSALTSKTIIFESGGADISSKASSDEIALAGKGFNKQVENEYRSRNANADYSAVDRMEAYEVQPSQVVVFIEQGKLAQGETAQ